MAFALRVPRPGEADLRVRPLPSSIARGVGANGIRPTCTGAERGRSTCPPASFILSFVGQGRMAFAPCVPRPGGADLSARPPPSSIGHGVGTNGIRPTCTEAERGEALRPPASFLYRSVGANGIRFTCAEGAKAYRHHRTRLAHWALLRD